MMAEVSAMHYERLGEGKRMVIFLHGFAGFSGIWRWQIDDISQKAGVIAVDLPGHGKSRWQNDTLSDMARKVRDVLAREGVQKADFVASSFGGLVAFKIFEEFPEYVQSLLFVGALPRFTATADFPAGLDPEKIDKLARQISVNEGTALDIFFRSLFSMKERQWEQYQYIKELRKAGPFPEREALFAFLELLETTDLRRAAAKVDRPTLFVLGDSDHICPLAVVRPLKALMPSAEIHVEQHAGHFPFLSKPYEFSRKIERFLKI
jgi:pimeloyl-[acyl-carrier protein] methyl ester esterase